MSGPLPWQCHPLSLLKTSRERGTARGCASVPVFSLDLGRKEEDEEEEARREREREGRERFLNKLIDEAKE